MRRWLFLIGVIFLTLLVPGTGQAAQTSQVQVQAQVGFGRMVQQVGTPAPSVGNAAAIQVQIPQFQRVERVYISFRFRGDLVDPGENLTFATGIGFTNIGQRPLRSRTMLFDRTSSLQDIQLFENRRFVQFNAYMEGSAHLTAVSLTIEGTLSP
jgi:hypothetical protein